VILVLIAGALFVLAAFFGTPAAWLNRDVLFLAGVFCVVTWLAVDHVLTVLRDRERRRQLRSGPDGDWDPRVSGPGF